VSSENPIVQIVRDVVDDLNLLKKVAKTLETLFGPATREIGEYLGDAVRERRIKRQAEFFIKFQKEIDQKGLKLTAIPDKILFPLIEVVSLEDDDALKEKWLSLMVNAVQGSDINLYPTFIELLRHLSPYEVKILEAIARKSMKSDTFEYSRTMHFEIQFVNTVLEELEILPAKGLVLIDNLIRLNLIEYHVNSSSSGLFAIITAHSRPTKVRLTNLGIDFFFACKR